MVMKSIALILFLAVFANVSAIEAHAITVEELVAKHLDAIGAAGLRRPGRSRIVAGSSIMNLRTGGRGTVSGAALFASHDEKVLLKAEFSTSAYPLERLAFDGRKFYARQYAPGSRSPLAQFFLSHDVIFSEGLIGGVLSSAWPLLNFSSREAKLEYGGTEKIRGSQAHKVKYIPHEGAELKITLFFDAETFHHLRTDYERVIPAAMGATPGASASQRETRYKLVEDFSDLRDESGLTLPHTYTLQFSIFQQNNPLALDWTINLTRFTFDYAIEAKEFVADN